MEARPIADPVDYEEDEVALLAAAEHHGGLTALPQVQVLTTATPLFDTHGNVGTYWVQNLGPYDVVITDATGTVNSVVVFAGGGPIVLDRVKGILYAKCPGGAQVSPADTRVLGDVG